MAGSARDILLFIQEIALKYSNGCQQLFGIQYSLRQILKLLMMVKVGVDEGVQISEMACFDQSHLNILLAKLYHKFKEHEDVDLISGVLKIQLKLDSTLDGSTKWSSPIDEWWLEVTALLDAAGVGKLGKAMDSNKEKQIVRSLVGNIDTKALRDSIRLIDPSSIRELYKLLSKEGVSHDEAQLVFRKFNFVATAAPNNAGARNNDNSGRNGDGGKKDSNRNPSGDKGKSNTSEEAAVKADNNAKRGASESEKTDGANVSKVKCWGCGAPDVLIYNCKKESCILENAVNNAKKEENAKKEGKSKSMATGGGARGKDNKAASNSRNQAQVHMLTAGEDKDLLPLSTGIVRHLPPKSLVFSQGNTTFIEDEADFDDNRKKYAEMISQLSRFFVLTKVHIWMICLALPIYLLTCLLNLMRFYNVQFNGATKLALRRLFCSSDRWKFWAVSIAN